MTDTHTPALVDTAWLAAHLNDPNLRILDASYFVPGGVEPARKQYDEGHISGAVFFDINDVAEPHGPKDHTFPSAAIFAAKVGALGVGNDHHVVAYDHIGGTCAAARVWFMFRAFGHTRVSVLDGGRTKWSADGHRMTQEPSHAPPTVFRVTAQPRLKSKTEMAANIEGKAFQVLDARGKGRFEGTEPEPRPGLRSGHIPGSRNLPFLNLIDADTKIWRSADTIRAQFAAAGIDLAQPLATTCGSGVSACTLALGAHLAGKADVAIYDGSWMEWGADATVPVTTGPAE